MKSLGFLLGTTAALIGSVAAHYRPTMQRGDSTQRGVLPHRETRAVSGVAGRFATVDGAAPRDFRYLALARSVQLKAADGVQRERGLIMAVYVICAIGLAWVLVRRPTKIIDLAPGIQLRVKR